MRSRDWSGSPRIRELEFGVGRAPKKPFSKEIQGAVASLGEVPIYARRTNELTSPRGRR
jgi:hypothetical protein